jgi:uncharacterized SAM-dependent methyltransferase
MAQITKLEAFLGMPDVSNITKEIFIDEQFGYFKISPMSLKQHKSYKRQSIDSRSGVINFDKLNMLIAVNYIVEPDFSNREFLDKAGYNTPEDVINAKIPSLTFIRITGEILKESGLYADINEKIEESKN